MKNVTFLINLIHFHDQHQVRILVGKLAIDNLITRLTWRWERNFYTFWSRKYLSNISVFRNKSHALVYITMIQYRKLSKSFSFSDKASFRYDDIMAAALLFPGRMFYSATSMEMIWLLDSAQHKNTNAFYRQYIWPLSWLAKLDFAMRFLPAGVRKRRRYERG